MVKHQPLQVYERQLCLSCLTGIYGCRWKRYQRSHDDTTKWECLWSFILFCTFSLLLVWFYFWWEAHNDYSEFNCVTFLLPYSLRGGTVLDVTVEDKRVDSQRPPVIALRDCACRICDQTGNASSRQTLDMAPSTETHLANQF